MGNIELFDQMAARYDTAERIQVAKHIAAAIRHHVGPTGARQHAMDYGCGTGLVGLELVDSFQSMVLTDASEPMVQQVQYKIEQLGLQTARTFLLDLMTQPFLEGTVDCVIVVQVLLHMEDVFSLLQRLYRLLGAGGHLLVVDFDKVEGLTSDKVHHGFDQGELIELCKTAGFFSAAAETFYHGKNLLMGHDASLFLLDGVKGSIDFGGKE